MIKLLSVPPDLNSNCSFCACASARDLPSGHHGVVAALAQLDELGLHAVGVRVELLEAHEFLLGGF